MGRLCEKCIERNQDWRGQTIYVPMGKQRGKVNRRKILRMFRQGATTRQIAERFDLTDGAINLIIKKGIAPAPDRRKQMVEEVRRIRPEIDAMIEGRRPLRAALIKRYNVLVKTLYGRRKGL